MSSTILTPEEIIQLRSKLPLRAISRIAKLTGVNRTNVSLILNAKYNRNSESVDKVISAAIDMLDSKSELRRRFEESKKSIIVLILAFSLLSCGVVNKMETSHYHYYYHTPALIVVKRDDPFVYCKSPAGIKFYRVRNLYGSFNEGDTIRLWDLDNSWVYGYTKFIKSIPE
jgi:hypothetical protein